MGVRFPGRPRPAGEGNIRGPRLSSVSFRALGSAVAQRLRGQGTGGGAAGAAVVSASPAGAATTGRRPVLPGDCGLAQSSAGLPVSLCHVSRQSRLWVAVGFRADEHYAIRLSANSGDAPPSSTALRRRCADRYDGGVGLDQYGLHPGEGGGPAGHRQGHRAGIASSGGSYIWQFFASKAPPSAPRRTRFANVKSRCRVRSQPATSTARR